MDDILSKVEEILEDPKKLEGFKTLASSLLNNKEESMKDKVFNDEKKINQSGNINDIENILKNFITQNKKGDNNNNNTDKFNMDLNMDLVFKLKSAMEIMNNDDKNIMFLKSLRELLADERRQKVDNAIKIMRLIKLLPIIKEYGFLKDFKLI